ncbi:MAG: bifunctional oligoribonuclease/PAP phosphatase NrnA [FCB group bacterium]|nr:bifunctional oligoribonuclease/PAP phosphatase NrnA [FCB group bacterium]
MSENTPGSFEEIAEFINSEDDFIITTHFSPDGDAIGSSLGMGELLRITGKKFRISIEGGLPEKYDFLGCTLNVLDPGSVEIEDKYSNALVLDAGTYDRIGRSKLMISDNAKIANIDHHLSNDSFGFVNYVDTTASSVAEILHGLAKHMKMDYSTEMANYLYLGLMTDTGRFRFSNTSPNALLTASELVTQGADPSWLSETIFYDLPKSYVKALGRALDSLEFFEDGKIALMQYMANEQIEDAEGIIDFAIGTRGVESAIFVRSIGDEKYKVSLRSRGRADVRQVAEIFGGGGHQKASGFRYKGDLEDLKFRLVMELAERMSADEYPI